jgi:hypothetical protein
MNSTAVRTAAPLRSTGRGLVGVSRYDRAASLLVTLLVLIGVSVGVLAFMWIGSRFVVESKAVPVTLVPDDPGGSLLGTSSDGVTLDAPTREEVARETGVALPDFRQTLAAVDDLIAARRAEVETVLGPLVENSGGGGSTGSGNAPAFGRGEGRGGLARSDRWEIRYASGETLADYCKELDFFGIELAAVERDGRAVYCRNFAQPKPLVDRNRTTLEQRLYMTWRLGSARRDTDRKLLERNGIATDGRTIVQFIPAAAEELLARLEYEFAKREPTAILRTRFAVRPHGAGFEFYVEDQTPR